MSLNESACGAAILAQLSTLPNVTNQAELQTFCNALGKALVDYFMANAVVQGTVLTGAGAGGQITGTLT